LSTPHQTQVEIENELLIIRKAQSDPNRFAPLYDKYYKQIFLFIYRRADNEETSADLTSQVFMKAIINLPKYEFKGVPFSAWLYRIASNEVNQHFRKNKTTRVISLEDSGIDRLAQELSELDDDTTIKEQVLTEGLQNLSKDEIQYIELRFFEDHSFKEIGFILNITENNAKVKTYRILDKIRKVISERIKIK